MGSCIFLLRNLSCYCTPEILKTVYYGLVYPHLSYGVCFWGNCYKTKVMRVFILQKAAIRIISRLHSRDSSKNAFKTLNILTLPSMYIYETIIYCISKCHVIQGREIHSHETRQAYLFRINQHRSKIYSKLPSQAGVTLYNKLPTELKKFDNFKSFKTKLKKYLLSKTFYSVDEFLNTS